VGVGVAGNFDPVRRYLRIPTAEIRHMAGWRYGIQVAIELENRRWVRLLRSCVASLIRAGKVVLGFACGGRWAEG